MSLAVLLRQPLLHFLFLGALIFAWYEWRADEEAEDAADARRIVVDRAALLDFMQYRARAFDPATFEARFDAMNTDEREALIADYVREEALFREALALGMDQGDYIIRQRLVQKVEFLLENLVGNAPAPDEATLQAFFEERRADYEIPASYSFTHVFFDAQRDGMAEAGARAEHWLAENARLSASEAAAHGDRFPFLLNYEGRSRDFVSNSFGEDFVAALDGLAPSAEWQGPLESRYGQHLVLLRERSAARIPGFDEVRSRLLDDYRYEALLRERERAEQDMLAEYEVVREL